MSVPYNQRHFKFQPGTISITPAAREALRIAQISSESLISRHCQGDFGQVEEQDAAANRASIQASGAVVSRYTARRFVVGLPHEMVWVCSMIQEGWTHICVESEAGGVFL